MENIKKVKQIVSFSEKLEELKKHFLEIATSSNAQQRGFKL